MSHDIEVVVVGLSVSLVALLLELALLSKVPVLGLASAPAISLVVPFLATFEACDVALVVPGLFILLFLLLGFHVVDVHDLGCRLLHDLGEVLG